MNQAEQQQIEMQEELYKDQLDMLGVMIFLAKHKKTILGVPCAAALVSAAVSFALPNTYKATTKLLPPQQSQSSAMALLSQLGGIAGIATGGGGLKNPNDMYVGMLQSRTIEDRLINRFKLKEVYQVDMNDKARERLENNTDVTSGKDGLITIEVESKDQKLVAPLANAYVDELLRLTNVLAVTEASQRRVFFQRQMEATKNNLAAAEAALKRSLDTHGVISVDVDSRAVLETGGRLRAQISLKEIQLNSMRAFVTTQNPDFQRTEQELKSLRAELSKLENGRGTSSADSENTRSESGLENIKILRDVKYQQMLYELLAKQFEIARLDEAKDSSIIQVLDPAVEPERKFKPKRAIIILVATFASFALALIIAFLRESKERMLQKPLEAKKWAQFKSYLSGKNHR
jgi:tyrosine-protein kinase Etk/Wzc